MDAVLDGDPARRPAGNPPRALRGRRHGRCDRGQALYPRDVPSARQPLPGLHPAFDDLHPRRLQLGLLRVWRRSRALDARVGDTRHPQRFRGGQTRPRCRDSDVGHAADDSAGDPADAQATHHLGAAVSAVALGGPVRRRRNYRLRRRLGETVALALGALILFWTLMPIYNIINVALESRGDVFTTTIWPANPSLESFWIVFTQGYWYLEHFWHQFGNSLYIGVA